MARNKNVASAKRFGSRYGRRNRDKYAMQERTARMKHSCPSCSYTQVKRLSLGIWQCNKCGYKFASRAFTVGPKTQLKVVTQEIL